MRERLAVICGASRRSLKSFLVIFHGLGGGQGIKIVKK